MNINLTMHNYCVIRLYDKNNQLVNEAKGYNTAYVKEYEKNWDIDTAVIQGKNQKVISLCAHETIEGNDLTTGWYRGNIPTYRYGLSDSRTYSEYEATVWYQAETTDTQVSSVILRHGTNICSQMGLTDINGQSIYLEVIEGMTVLINLHIYFKINIKKIGLRYPVTQWKGNKKEIGYSNEYKFDYFDAGFSIFHGSVGNNSELLKINDTANNCSGYLPKLCNTGIGITKSPEPPSIYNDDLKINFLLGGILEYQLIPETSGNVYRNSHAELGTWKGLIRGLVLPHIGYISLPNPAIFEPKSVRLELKDKKDENEEYELAPCYIPEEYIIGDNIDKSKLISMRKNGLYNAPVVTVRRFYPATSERPKVHDEVQADVPFFSDLDPNYGTRRAKGYSHHVPLTENTYCGTETIIPCTRGQFKNEPQSYYGYLIDYTQTVGSGEELTLDYAVSGEYVWENFDGIRTKQIFPYILEYSYDGNIFSTAIDFRENNKQPYIRYDFGPITAPIWRIRSEVGARNVLNIGTTHSDPTVAAAVGGNGTFTNGYDPLFIFVGNSKDKNNNGFIYETDLNSPNLMSVSGDFKITVPYLCHENDNFYLSGITVGDK